MHTSRLETLQRSDVQLSERLASLSIIGPIEGHLKISRTIIALYLNERFEAGDPELGPHYGKSRYSVRHHTQRILFEILLNQTEIRLYVPFSD